MLTSTFLLAQGISEEHERLLWGRGLLTWDLARRYAAEVQDALGPARAQRLLATLAEAQEALTKGNHNWFRQHLDPRENWRLWHDFCAPDAVALLDIETTGRTPGYDRITVIGLSDGQRERAFIADRPQAGDEPLSGYLEAIKAYRLVVTFNGIGFDIPFIERHFRDQGYHLEQPHLDLMPLARSLGLTGGLKDMEQQIGIRRESELADMRGHEAIALWGAWKQGDRAAYDRLVSYCKADCTNLLAFAEHCYRKKRALVYEPFAREVDFDATQGQQLSLF